MTKEKIRVVVLKGYDDYDITFSDLIERIPLKHRDKQIQWSTNMQFRPTLWYEREETDKEFKKRSDATKKREKTLLKEKEIRKKIRESNKRVKGIRDWDIIDKEKQERASLREQLTIIKND